MQIQGDSAIRFNTPSQPPAVQSRADAMIEQASTAFGAVDTRALAQAILAPMLSGGAGNANLLRDVSGQLSPVQQGDLQRDLGETIAKLVDSIVKFFRSMFGGATNAPTAPTPAASTPAAPAPTAPTQVAPTPVAPAPTPTAAAPATAADNARMPGAEAIARNPVVAAAISASWAASNPNTPGSKVETGFWVVRDDKSGALSVVQFPSNGTNDSLTPGRPPAIDGKTTVAFFHTHPNTAAEGYTSGPSAADQRFANAVGLPGIIRSHDGLIYFNNR